ncbi:RNA polymerase sigma factor [Bacillus sp. T33-2]|uniref:RNA polymerase sigma factor n=1 Tax=Bacillus sp. T33-2 TaxID=2054168 RepID=UPI000C775775|nr:RNA polymerase sigma factor [Bacillus sp. T33-2]PLR94156.1 RNA polymerase sigma factor [Bacillus sp. T33-2]
MGYTNKLEIDFNELVLTYSKKLYQVAYAVTRDVHVAEDVVQETFIKAFKKIGSINDHAKIGAWLSSIAARTAIDFIRAERRKKCFPVDQLIMEQVGNGLAIKESVEGEVEAALLKEEILDLVNLLTYEHQEILLLKANFGLKEDEIAQQLELRSSTVKTRLYRARKQLKGFLSQKNTA